VIWLSWRLQRTETLVVLGVLALLTALLLPTGLNMWDAYHHLGIGACSTTTQSSTCENAIGLFRSRFQSLSDLATWFTLLPGLIGVVLAAPLVSDLEQGTNRLAWTQSVTRGRWLAGKLASPILAALAASGGLILLFTWWRGPVAHLDGRIENGIFDTTGTVVIGYMLFALGLALALGVVWRRTAASLAVAFAAYFAVRLMVDYKLRPLLVAPARAVWRGLHQPASMDNAHVLSIVATLRGHTILHTGGFLGGGPKLAAPNLADARFHAVYQPVSHYWPLQLTETALFAGLALLLIAFAAWRVLASD
jgi:ABC-type transport system involved in multi-copper enzyme maturation permease subunit